MPELCTACEGNGWITDAEDDKGNAFVRPCARCRPAVYDRWRGGHLEPGHYCEECSTRKPLKTAPKPFTLPNSAPDSAPVEAF